MSRNLLLLRHGEAELHASEGDAARELTDVGRRDAERVGLFLAERGLVPDLVVASPARRARQSAERMHKAMDPTRLPDIRHDARIWEATPEDLLAVIAGIPMEARNVLIVGHNPGLSALVWRLTGPQAAGLRPASLAMLEVPGRWATLGRGDIGAGRRAAWLRRVLHVCELPLDFPFPGEPGRRARAQYCYRQSAVIPWREGADGMEVLITRSSGARNHIIPKGVHEPGMTAAQSAEMEAREEAGALGEIKTGPLGRCELEKWGAVCSVEVFEMRVEALLPEAEWEERHRTREWLPWRQAAALLKSRDMAEMLEDFALSREARDAAGRQTGAAGKRAG